MNAADSGSDMPAKPQTERRRKTFKPASVDDRFDKRVRDDHAPNQALHDAIKAAAEDDDRIHSVNLMGSHAPGNRHKGEPRYTVSVEVRNEGMGHPVIGATFVGRMVDAGDVRITDVVECSDDHLVVSIRPVEARVEPIQVPVADIPDSVVDQITPDDTDDGDFDGTTSIPCGCGDYWVDVPNGNTPPSIDVVCPKCDNHFGHGGSDE